MAGIRWAEPQGNQMAGGRAGGRPMAGGPAQRSALRADGFAGKEDLKSEGDL